MLAIPLAITLAIALQGCNTFRKSKPPANTVPVLTKQAVKDEKIVQAADVIDTVTAPTPVAAEVKVQTDVIRAAVKEAPAADVVALTKSLESAVAKAQQRADKAEAKSNTAIKVAIFGISSLVTMAGVALMFLGAQIGFAGPRMGLSVAAAGITGVGIGIAFDFATKHPWVVGVSLGFIVLAIGIAIANHLNEKPKL